jgi:hypothetical protein
LIASIRDENVASVIHSIAITAILHPSSHRATDFLTDRVARIDIEIAFAAKNAT